MLDKISRNLEILKIGRLKVIKMELIIFLGLILAVWIAAKVYSQKKRREELMSKYSDQKIVEQIIRRSIWQGQTKEQLIDSIGKPIGVDERVYKSKKAETWKYNQTGAKTFALRIIIEDGVVVGWEKK